MSLSIYDLSGRLITSLIDAEMPAGTHHATWDGTRSGIGGRRVPSGTYFVRLRVGDVTDMRRVTLMK